MPKVILSGHIIVPPSDLAAIRQALPQHIAATQAEPGCLVFQVKEDQTQHGRFSVYEEFIDQAAFDAHQKRSQSSNWGQVSQNIERHYTLQGGSE